VSLIACSFALVAGILDARDERIPNWLTIPGILCGLVIAYLREGASGLVLATLGLCVCGGILAVPFFATRGVAIGGGDVKCWAALGCMLGPGLGLSALLTSLCLLVLFALFREAFRGHLVKLLVSTYRVALRKPQQEELALSTMRFGPAIAIGTVLTAYPQLRESVQHIWP
jgi:prepilin peptidase CpaA